MEYGVRVALVIFSFLVLVLYDAECARKTKPVGKCLNREGQLRCNSKQICAAGSTLCEPYTMSPLCKCKKNRVIGCEDSTGSSVCKLDERCLVKKTGEPCLNERSRKCKCRSSSPPRKTPPESVDKGPPMPPPSGPDVGCKVEVDGIQIKIPFDMKYHEIGIPCKECICVPRYPAYVDSCRTVPNCNGAIRLQG